MFQLSLVRTVALMSDWVFLHGRLVVLPLVHLLEVCAGLLADLIVYMF